MSLILAWKRPSGGRLDLIHNQTVPIFFNLTLVFAYFLTCPLTVSAQSNKHVISGIQTFQTAYNKWNPLLFESAIQKFKKSTEKPNSTSIGYYWAGAVYFHLVNYYLFGEKKSNDKKKGGQAIEDGIQVLKKMIHADSLHAESYALLGTLYGIKIYQKPYTAPILGPKVFSLITKGLDLQPRNPRIHYLIGISYVFTPRILGGGVDKGLKHLLESEAHFAEEQQQSLKPEAPRWGYSTCVGFIGRAYAKKKQPADAEAYYKKALSINPDDLLAISGLKELKNRK